MLTKTSLALALRKRGFRIHKSASPAHAAIAAEFPMHYMNLVHVEKNTFVMFTIAFDADGRTWTNVGNAFPELASLGFTEFFLEELTADRPKKPR